MRMSSPLPQPGHRVIVTRAVAAAACALLAAACGSTAGPSTASGSHSGTAGTASAARVSLDVTFAASRSTAGKHYTLTCDPAGGTTPDAATACGKLLKTTGLFAPKSAHVMCPMILASAGRATVSGTYLGKKVHETIIDGGCDIGRWQQLKQIFVN